MSNIFSNNPIWIYDQTCSQVFKYDRICSDMIIYAYVCVDNGRKVFPMSFHDFINNLICSLMFIYDQIWSHMIIYVRICSWMFIYYFLWFFIDFLDFLMKIRFLIAVLYIYNLKKCKIEFLIYLKPLKKSFFSNNSETKGLRGAPRHFFLTY